LETWSMQKICIISIMAHEGIHREAQFQFRISELVFGPAEEEATRLRLVKFLG